MTRIKTLKIKASNGQVYSYTRPTEFSEPEFSDELEVLSFRWQDRLYTFPFRNVISYSIEHEEVPD